MAAKKAAKQTRCRTRAAVRAPIARHLVSRVSGPGRRNRRGEYTKRPTRFCVPPATVLAAVESKMLGEKISARTVRRDLGPRRDVVRLAKDARRTRLRRAKLRAERDAGGSAVN